MRAAFTLVELLVTIAIIALLLAIIAPAFAAARAAALDTRCKSQVRSVGQALSNYHAMNRRFFDNPLEEEGVNQYLVALRNLRARLDGYLDASQEPELGVRTQPWVCALDKRNYFKTGASYTYVAGASYQLRPDPRTGRSVQTPIHPAVNYDINPHIPVYSEAGDHPPTMGLNDYFIDGSIRVRVAR
ncbi:MAG: prepilin-type N-terminal cleavage/methylation domain-containing protein [Phycisphaerales bacterium]